MLFFMFSIICGLFEWKRIYAFFFLLLLFISIQSLEIQLSRGRVGSTLIGLTSTFCCACPTAWSGTCWCVFVFNNCRSQWEVVVCFVDNDGIVDHHWLNYIFIIRSCANVYYWFMVAVSCGFPLSYFSRAGSWYEYKCFRFLLKKTIVSNSHLVVPNL